MEYIGDAIQSSMNALARASGTTVDAVQQYQSLQAQSIVANKRAEYMRQRNSLVSQIQGDTTITPDQWNDKWLEQSSELADYYGRDDNPVANRALQQMVSDGNEEVRSRFENTKAQWYKGQARVTCANGIQAGIDAGDLQQINDNLMTFEPLADSPQQMEQAKATAANSYLMKTGLLQLEQEMKTNGKSAADAMFNISDYSVVLYDGSTKTLTPELKRQLKTQYDGAWADYVKQNDDALGHVAGDQLVKSAYSVSDVLGYLKNVEGMSFIDGDEKWKWWSRGLELLDSLKAKAAKPNKELEEKAKGLCALAARSLDNKAAYQDTVNDFYSKGWLPGDSVDTVMGYWDKKDSILDGELNRINAWKVKDKSGKQIMSDERVAAIAGIVSQYRNTPGNERLTADDMRKFTDTITNKELAASLFLPKKLKETYDPKNVDAQEAAISMFQGGYLGWMQENGAFEAWRDAVGLPKNASYKNLVDAIGERSTEMMKSDYRKMMGKEADNSTLSFYVDKGNGLPTVSVTRPSTVYSRDGKDQKGTTTDQFVLKIMTQADFVGSSNERAKVKHRADVGEETWFKVINSPNGVATYQYWCPAGHGGF